MILLDTNVVSEAMTREPHPRCAPGSMRKRRDAVSLQHHRGRTSLRHRRFASGKRKDALAAALDDVLDLFAARILPFDTSAARRYADLAVKARAAGKGFPTPDGYIAAIAAAHGFAVASRDTSAFNAAGLTVIDPWTVTG